MYKIPVLQYTPKRPNIYMHVYILPNPPQDIHRPTNHRKSPLNTKKKIKYPKPTLRLANLLLAEELEIPNTNTQVEQ